MPIEPAPESAPDLADVPSSPRPWLDLQAWIQAIAGTVVALIALLTSYDHISFPAGVRLPIEQQWGVWCIVASVALVVADAQLATGSRRRAARDSVRAAQDAARAADEAARERDRADRERNRAAEAREQAARSDRVQARALRAGALVWLEPSLLHRRFLALVAAELAALAEEPEEPT